MAPLVHSIVRRLPAYARVAAVTLVVLWLAFLGMGRSTEGARHGGDFAPFYGAGKLVAEGRTRDLYSPWAQRESQRDAFPSGEGYLVYGYPPVVAGVYAAVASLPFRVAYALHTLWMLVCLCGAGFLLSERSNVSSAGTLAACVLCFFPAMEAVLGGQNGAFSLLLVSAALLGLDRGLHFVSGLCIGLLCYKPQLGVPLLLVLLAMRHLRAVAGAGVGAAAVYLGSVAVMGAGWFPLWWRWATAFVTHDAHDARLGVSWTMVAESMLHDRPGFWMTWIPVGLFALIGLHLLLRSRGSASERLVAAVPLLLLASPHAMRYDLILVVPLLLGLVMQKPTLFWIAVVLGTASCIHGAFGMVMLLVLAGNRFAENLKRTPEAVAHG